MRFAVIEGDNPAFVVNVIVAEAEQAAELAGQMGAELVDAAPLGLERGDMFNGTAWTRNVDGEQRALPVAPSDADALLAILTGEVE